MDKIVIDIETKNFFNDPGVGPNNFAAIEPSAIGIYSYAKNKYFCFEEHEAEEALRFFEDANLIVGFSINRYDIPVLHHYFERNCKGKIDIWQKPRLDLLEEIEMSIGARPSLNYLALANLGIGKTRKSHEAITLYKSGQIEELKEYCLQDVKITKELYELSLKQRYLLVPQRYSDEMLKCEFEYI